MRVVHLSSVHPRYDTRIFIKECTSLVHAGIEVYFVVADGMGDEEKNGVHIIDAGPRKQSRLLRMIQTVQKVFNKACKIDADYFHLHDPELLPLVPFLQKRGKIIYDMHENVPKQILTKEWIPKIFRSLISKMFQFLEKLFLRNTHVIFAELSYAKDYSWLKNTTTILNMPLVSNLETIAKKVSKYSHFSLGYIGGVSPVRGSIIILEALRILKSRHVSFFFECVGPISNSHEKELLAFLKKYNLENNVKYYGYLPAEEGWGIIASCHVGLAILKPIPNYLESYPTKLFEYMGLGLPFITSSFPLYKSIVNDTHAGITVSPLNPNDIANNMFELAQNPEKIDQMRKNGFLAVRNKYNWQHEADKLLKGIYLQ